jgi:hypothetical protein
MGMRAARGAGSSAAGALMNRAMPSAQAWGQMTMAQPLAWA